MVYQDSKSVREAAPRNYVIYTACLIEETKTIEARLSITMPSKEYLDNINIFSIRPFCLTARYRAIYFNSERAKFSGRYISL